ncbi:hypothetical protein DKM19_01425 [Streptosporangium sp. 'caverna']|nr:hypothetical protein DKM19_01425 [Streptosporangium sp. 'caverna']
MAFLRGKLRTNHDVVLLDATLTRWMHDRALVTGGTALVGLGLPSGQDQPKFGSITFQVGGLTELSGASPIKETYRPASLAAPDTEFKMVWNSDVDQEWTALNGDKITLGYTAINKMTDHYEYYVKTHPYITVEGEYRTAGQWMQDYVYPVRQITSFATARRQPLSWITLEGKNERNYRAQLFAADIAQEPYEAQEPKVGFFTTLLRLGATGLSLATLIDRWQRLHEEHETFFDVFADQPHQRDTSLRSRLLLLVPALESYHSGERGDGTVTREQHRAQRKAVLEQLTQAGADSDTVKWVKEQIDDRPGYPLNKRLRELVDELSPELRDRIQTRITSLPPELDFMGGDVDVWNVMGKVRNNLGHGGTIHTDDQLLPLVRLADTLTIGLALKKLNVPDTALIRAIDCGEWALF